MKEENEWAPPRTINAGCLFNPTPQNNPEVVSTSEDTVAQYAAMMGVTTTPKKDGYLKDQGIDMPDDNYTRLFNQMPEYWQKAEMEKIFGKVK
jgi:hypothetical protein